MHLEAMANPFRSKRIQRVPKPPPPDPALMGMGWSPAADSPGSLPLDPVESERAQRRAGATALARLHEEEAERKREAMEARLAGVRRGRDYSKGLHR